MNARMKTTEPAVESVSSGKDVGLLENIKNGSMSSTQLMTNVQELESIGEFRAACNLFALWLDSYKGGHRHIFLYNYGSSLQKDKNFNEAVVAYKSSIKLCPEFSQAYINLGLLYEKIGNQLAALQIWLHLIDRRGTKKPPESEFVIVALNNIGRLQEVLNNYAQSEHALAMSLGINPDQPGVIQHLVHIRQKACSWPIYRQLAGVSFENMKRYTSPLAMLAYTEEPSEQLLCSQAFCQRTYAFKEERLSEGRVYKHKRLRVGYVSGDFREHAVGFLVPSLVQGHDKAKFELFAYDFSLEEKTLLRSKLKNIFEHFKSIGELSDRQAAELMLSDEIDILIDLHGLSSGARPGIFALHPAPRQGSYLGFMGPTGMPWLDFVIADQCVLPNELVPHFTEKPLYVEDGFFPMVSYHDSKRVATRGELGLAPDAFVMSSFSNTFKITQEMFGTWIRLLKYIPNSVLWLIDDNKESTSNLKAHALAQGVGPERLLFSPRVEHMDFCARLKLADVYLDTYPYNSGSTSNDVIHAGVPIVTMYGKTLVSRMGLSLMTKINCTSSATQTYDEYFQKVVDLSNNQNTVEHPKLPLRQQPLRLGEALSTLFFDGGAKAMTPTMLGKPVDPGLKVFHICSDEEAPQGTPKGFLSLKNIDGSRAGWSEFLSIRDYLRNHCLDDNTFYGFLSPAFTKVTGINIEKISDFVTLHGDKHDVLILSPYWDLNCFFINSFEQGNFFHPDFIASSQQFVREIGIDLDLSKLVMHEDNSALGNYFIAKKIFWIEWLDLAEKLMECSENIGGSLSEAMNKKSVSNYDILPLKTFLQERLVNLILARSQYKSKALHIFELPSSVSPLSRYKSEAITLNALKHSFSQEKKWIYLDEYYKLRKKVWAQCGIDSFVIDRSLSVSNDKLMQSWRALLIKKVLSLPLSISKVLQNCLTNGRRLGSILYLAVIDFFHRSSRKE